MNFRLIGSIAGLVLVAGGLTACSAVANTAECVLVVGNGGGEAHTVKKVVYPGESHGDEGDDWQKHVPCGQRNFIINPPGQGSGDRHNPVVGRTGASEDGKTPPMMVKSWVTANWELNQNEPVLKKFWIYCQKYNCASDNELDNSKNFSSDGWSGMLRESLSPAIDRAGAIAISKFGPDLWKNLALRGKLAEEFSSAVMNELKDPLSGNPFFCGRGSESRDKGECKPIKFTIEGIDPVDDRVIQIENNAQASNQEQNQDQSRIDRTNKLYGPYGDYYRGLQDTIDRCNGKTACQIYVGTQPNVKP